MANKITKAQMFAMIKEVEGVKANAEMVAFINHEIELLANKRSTKKPTKVQKANEELLPKIAEVLGGLGKATVSEILAKGVKGGIFEEGTSNQKVSALMKKLVDTGVVTKETEKGKSVFFLAEGGEEVGE